MVIIIIIIRLIMTIIIIIEEGNFRGPFKETHENFTAHILSCDRMIKHL